MGTLLVTRSIRRDIDHWCKIKSMGWSIIDQSLIQFIPMAFKLVSAEWLFFSSKNGVKYFFNGLSDEGKSKLPRYQKAAIGQATAEALSRYVDQIDYIGDGLFKDKDSFLTLVQPEARILFPMARHSRRYVQRQLVDDRETYDLAVYDNIHRAIDLPKIEISLMTSPMNAASFIEQYNYDLNAVQMISVGPATSRSLIDQQLKVAHQMSQPLEQIWAKEAFDYIVGHY